MHKKIFIILSFLLFISIFSNITVAEDTEDKEFTAYYKIEIVPITGPIVKYVFSGLEKTVSIHYRITTTSGTSTPLMQIIVPSGEKRYASIMIDALSYTMSQTVLATEPGGPVVILSDTPYYSSAVCSTEKTVYAVYPRQDLRVISWIRHCNGLVTDGRIYNKEKGIIINFKLLYIDGIPAESLPGAERFPTPGLKVSLLLLSVFIIIVALINIKKFNIHEFLYGPRQEETPAGGEEPPYPPGYLGPYNPRPGGMSDEASISERRG